MEPTDADTTVPGADGASSVGATIGRYRIDGVLGQGGMGTVFRAHDPDLDRPLAIKVLHPGLRRARERLLKEGQAVARLRHPNVITVHDVGTDGDAMFIAMELVEGGTLREHLAARPRSRPEIMALFLAAGRGLEAAHAAGLVHRDFKPDNVLIGDDGRIVVGDFGLAQEGATDSWPAPPTAPGADPALTAGVSGTPAYMAPEQARGERVDARSDQFAFCVSLWEALHGDRPSADPAPRTRSVPSRLHAALVRGLSPAPDARFSSMRDLLAQIQPRTRRPLFIGALAVGALAAIAAVLITWPTGSRLVRADAGACASTFSPIALSPAAPYVDWLREYQTKLGLSHRAVCVGDAIRGTESEDVRACLDEGAADLRAATARSPGSAVPWPFLRSLRACRWPVAERNPLGQPAAMGEVFWLSPDAERILVWRTGPAPVIVIRDRDTAVEMVRLPASATPLRWLDDKRVALQRDASIIVCDAASGEILEEHPVQGSVLDVTSDLRRAVVFEANRIRLVTLHTGTTTPLLDAEVATARISPDGERIALVDLIRDLIVVHEIATGDQVEISVPPAGQFAKAQVGWLGPHSLVIGGALARETDEWLARLRLAPSGEPAGAPEPLIGAGQMSSLLVDSVSASHVLLERIVIDARLEVRTADHVEPAPSSLARGRIAWAADDGSRFLAHIDSRWFYVALPGWQMTELEYSEAGSIVSAQGAGTRTVGILTRDGASVYFELEGDRLSTRALPTTIEATSYAARCHGAACIVLGANEREVEVHSVTAGGFEPLVHFEPDGGLPGGRVRSVDVTRDGRRIVVTTSAFRTFVVEPRHATREIQDSSCPVLVASRFAPDERSLLYTCVGADHALRRQELASGVIKTVLSDSSIDTTSFEPLSAGSIVLTQQTRAGTLELVDVLP